MSSLHTDTPFGLPSRTPPWPISRPHLPRVEAFGVSHPGVTRRHVQALTPASMIMFRYRTTLKNVVSEWKQSTGIVIT